MYCRDIGGDNMLWILRRKSCIIMVDGDHVFWFYLFCFVFIFCFFIRWSHWFCNFDYYSRTKIRYRYHNDLPLVTRVSKTNVHIFRQNNEDCELILFNFPPKILVLSTFEIIICFTQQWTVRNEELVETDEHKF